MSRTLTYLLYNALLPFLLVFSLPGYLVKGWKRGGLGRNIRHRFGALPPSVGQLGAKPLWIHAVSVGEVLVAVKIIRALRRKRPELAMVFSTTTSTGYAVAEKELGDDSRIVLIHNPVDLPWVVRRVISKINPEKLILVESEIWPNLLRGLRKRGVPVLLANARLSPRSEERYRRFRPLIAPVFCQIERISVPFAADVERWAALGVARESVTVLGSVKFDESAGGISPEKVEELKGWLRRCGWEDRQPIFLAGSTHSGEERIVCQVWRELKAKHPALALVIVPRHAERAAAIKSELENMGVHPVLRSQQQRCEQKDDDRVYVSDTTGELRAWFQIAEVVFIGKSLTGKGGQNLAEPILAGKPVMVGPHMQNFREITADLAARGGILQVASAEGLREAVDGLLSDRQSGARLAAAGRAAMESHHGAAQRTADWIMGD